MIYWMKELVSSLVRRKGKWSRKYKREAFDLTVTYNFIEVDKGGQARVLNVSSGGACLQLQHAANVGDTLKVRMNPYAFMKHFKGGKVVPSKEGDYFLKVVWSQKNESGEGYIMGGTFFKVAPSSPQKMQEAPKVKADAPKPSIIQKKGEVNKKKTSRKRKTSRRK